MSNSGPYASAEMKAAFAERSGYFVLPAAFQYIDLWNVATGTVAILRVLDVYEDERYQHPDDLRDTLRTLTKQIQGFEGEFRMGIRISPYDIRKRRVYVVMPPNANDRERTRIFLDIIQEARAYGVSLQPVWTKA